MPISTTTCFELIWIAVIVDSTNGWSGLVTPDIFVDDTAVPMRYGGTVNITVKSVRNGCWACRLSRYHRSGTRGLSRWVLVGHLSIVMLVPETIKHLNLEVWNESHLPNPGKTWKDDPIETSTTSSHTDIENVVWMKDSIFRYVRQEGWCCICPYHSPNQIIHFPDEIRSWPSGDRDSDQ